MTDAATASTTTAASLATKRVVYVGGLPSEAGCELVRAAAIPFGEIRSVDMVR